MHANVETCVTLVSRLLCHQHLVMLSPHKSFQGTCIALFARKSHLCGTALINLDDAKLCKSQHHIVICNTTDQILCMICNEVGLVWIVGCTPGTAASRVQDQTHPPCRCCGDGALCHPDMYHCMFESEGLWCFVHLITPHRHQANVLSVSRYGSSYLTTYLFPVFKFDLC